MLYSSNKTLLAFSIAFTACQAAKGTLGFALGTKKADSSCKAQADYESDFKLIAAASGSKIVRGYSASDCNAAREILPAAKSQGFQVILGIWPDVEKSYNDDKAAITTYAPKFADQVYAVTVGSETLYRGNFTGATLLAKVNDMKNALKGTKIKVGTADSWNKYADGTADDLIRGNPDILLVNAFGFWQGQDTSNATHQYFDDIMQAYQHIGAINPSHKIELWTGETGWPSDGGTDFKAAKAGTKNAATYFSQGICGMLNWGYNVFAFEAFDEPWKPKSKGDGGILADETHWGAMTVDGKSKYSLKC
ncbi:putative glucan 1,3-beta-glucosidase [Tothia fuscella]|uniref:glucan 1,3-beta-glucosidase n=1 Tax=Tothia fuscella TaxID=1048955 RepID=A0A9P4NNB6_9PEZI|nr:putative glucan 1,3-beta-glucosidase [Tothia fuscella]